MCKRLSLVLCLVLGSTTSVWAQGQTSANFLGQAFNRVTESASGAAKLDNYGYQEGVSILGGWINCRESLHYYVPLTQGVKYMFAAGGDNDAENLDLEIQDENGKAVANENRVAADSLLKYTAGETGWFILKLTLSQSRKNFPCVCVVCILKENGHKVPLKDLDDCADRMLKLFGEADKIRQKDNFRLELHRGKNDWSVYGGVVSKGQQLTVRNLDLGLGLRHFLALGDKNAKDVDLFILDKDGTVVAQDATTNSEAIVVMTPARGKYGIRMLHYDGAGPSVVMTAVFDSIPAKKQ